MRCILFLAAFVVVEAPAADPAPPIDKLIEQLASPSFPIRERATRLLREAGPASLPALRKAAQSGDEEVRKRAETLIPKLEIEEALLPRRVTLDVKEATLTDVLREIGTKTGCKVSAMGAGDPGKVTLQVKDMPFWEVLERVDRMRGFSYVGHDRSIRLAPSVGRSPFARIQGSFRLEATWFHEDRDVNFAPVEKGPVRDGGLTLAVSVLAEPRLTILKTGPADVTEAVDSEGNSLLEAKDAPKIGRPPAGRGTFRGEAPHFSDIRLQRAGGSAKALRVVRGTVPVKVIAVRRSVVVSHKVLESLGTKFRAGTDGLEVTRVTQQGGGSIEVEFAVPPDQNNTSQWSERFFVEDESGNRFQKNGSGGRSNGQQYWASVYFAPPFNKKVGPPTRLILEDWVIHDHAIPFEFRDVPLP